MLTIASLSRPKNIPLKPDAAPKSEETIAGLLSGNFKAL